MTIDDVLQLQQPLTAGAIRNVNFFNGRLLTSKDLTREQEARREADARLGLALGEGVAQGLEVAEEKTAGRPDGTYVSVNAGVAINRAGQVLRLPQKTTVALTQQFTSELLDNCIFRNCERLRGGTYRAGAGVYVLTLAPSAATEGRAPTNGLDPTNVRCNTDVNVEALQFRLLKLTTKMLSGLDFGSSTLRNELAYRCFGAGIQSDWFASLLTAQPRQDDLLESLREIGLGEQEVPLALLDFKDATTLGFVDSWAVRRPLHRPESGAMSGLVETRRIAVGRAMFMQFQSQIEELKAPFLLPSNVSAKSHFRYLPPVGFVPVGEESDNTDARATTFFSGLSYRNPAYVNAARLESLLEASLRYPPIDPFSGELIWLYRVRENRMAIDFQALPSPPVNYVVFASGHLPFLADPQCDTAHWNYSNFASTR